MSNRWRTGPANGKRISTPDLFSAYQKRKQ
jgi:hypothetical protein